MSFSLRERARYAFDNTLAKGTIALIAWLAIVSLLGIAFIAGLVVLTGAHPPDGEPLSFIEAVWGNLMRTLDAGTMGGDEGWLFRGWMFLVTLLGIFILSTLIGVLSSGLEGQLDNLRKGRSRVVEHDHTVILGWSEQVFPIISELVEANASRRNACIVMLGEKDKVEMEDAVAEAVDDTRTTRIVCRNGSPRSLHDLYVAGIDTARSIIIVAPEDEKGEKSADPDVDVIKALLAITNNPNRKASPYHIVAEIRDPKNFAVAQMVGKDEVELVLVGDLVARIMAQTCRQSGLSVVYTELLDFGGDEIYFKEEPALVGKTYADALHAYEDCAVIGMRKNNVPPVLNPKTDTPIEAGDKMIVVAEDDDAIKLGAPPAPPNAAAIVAPAEHTAQPERSLILGWNWRAPAVINELDNYVPPGSTIHVVADSDSAEEAIRTECGALKRQKLQFRRADTTDRRVLDALKVHSYEHVIVLCYSDTLDVQKADAITLITLLHLRDIADKTKQRIPVVSEMLDIKNRALAEVTRADDFIVSDKLVSLMLSQISENKELNQVFAELFSADGSEIYLKPAVQYVTTNVPLTFSTVVAAAAQRSESALGYKLAAQASDASKSYGVVVNPDKSAPVTFGPHDKIIVLAEN
ncbi:MAG: potassium transporter TrkA [Deltaproteobacteria bacterium RBG_16_71_12]|nr:MAG: potassium transporter TrkA [Deltaproteobacteria bacterium RBG_16_71_12]